MSKVYIVHGWTYSLDKWQTVCDLLRQRGIEPVLLKVPGLTETSDKIWDIDGYVGWLDGQLDGVDKPVVIGHSNGGRIALHYVQKYPDRLGKLILIDSAGIAHNEKRSVRKLQTLKTLSKVGKPFTKVPGARKVFYKVIGARDYYEASPNMRQTMRNMLAADQQTDFTAIKLPVTIIWGREDTITPLSDGQKIHAAITGSTLNIVDNARHAPFFTRPDVVADLIMKAVGN